MNYRLDQYINQWKYEVGIKSISRVCEIRKRVWGNSETSMGFLWNNQGMGLLWDNQGLVNQIKRH
jgi:hypothetical protein